jgi:SAM-dependent methyltransferase
VGSHWFEPVADHLGDAYLRYSFTKGTRQEIDAIEEMLRPGPGARILDVGCGPGRHSLELAARGYDVTGIDISSAFIEIARSAAPENARFERMDARAMPFRAEFDLVICLCQGAFGLMTADGDDETVVRRMAEALRPGGRLVLSAFNAYFAVKYFTEAEFDADAGVNHEITVVRNPAGEERTVDLWTGCYTPRELRLLARECGLSVEAVHGVDPGAYRPGPATVETSEFLLIASTSPSRREGARHGG